MTSKVIKGHKRQPFYSKIHFLCLFCLCYWLIEETNAAMERLHGFLNFRSDGQLLSFFNIIHNNSNSHCSNSIHDKELNTLINDQAERHDLKSLLWLFFSHFLFPPKKGKKKRRMNSKNSDFKSCLSARSLSIWSKKMAQSITSA